MNQEVSRLLRHGALVLVTWGVAKGWVPAELQGPVVEFATVGLTLAATLAFSKASDRAITSRR